jgi:hypothetical protein
MHWLADECVDATLVRQLRRAGEDVTYMIEAGPGATDTAVLRNAQEQRRLLLTEDKDFGELVFRSGLPVPGPVFLRLMPEEGFAKWSRLKAAIDQFGPALFGRYVVVETNRLRSRPLLRTVE